MAGEAATDGPIASVKYPVSRLKDPRYTGENRCRPCTGLNVAAATIGSTLLGGWLGGASTTGFLVGAVAFAVSCAAIYLRGYLVPGTPTLTRRYLPDRIRAWFGTADEPASRTEFDPETLLRELGIVIEDDDGTDLVLDSTFEAAWIEAVDDFAATTEDMRLQLADALDVDPADLELERRPGSFDACHETVLFARWESKPACQADVAAAAIMPLFDADWGHRTFETRSELLGALRLFLEICPTCRGAVSLDHEVVRSCCSERDVVVATCGACNARIFEVAVDFDGLATESAPATLD